MFAYLTVNTFHIVSASYTECITLVSIYIGVKLFIGSKVQCVFCFEICTPEGRRGGRGGSANFIRKHTEPLTQEIPRSLYVYSEVRISSEMVPRTRALKHPFPPPSVHVVPGRRRKHKF